MCDVDLFLVRVWRGLPSFRASVRRVDHDLPRLFGSADELARFLALPPEPGPGVRDADTPRPPNAEGDRT